MRDYRERLYVPLVWWLLAVPIVLILGGTLYAGLPWPWPIVIIGGLAVGCTALLIALGRGTVEFDNAVLRAGDASLPLAAIMIRVSRYHGVFMSHSMSESKVNRSPWRLKAAS